MKRRFGERHLASVGLGMAGDEGGRLNACTNNIVLNSIQQKHYTYFTAGTQVD